MRASKKENDKDIHISGAEKIITDIHDLLEQKIADYQETQSSIVFNTGYVANLATIAALCTSNTTIFSDELNHASIIDGCRLSKAKIVTYKHNDMTDLKRKIEKNPFIELSECAKLIGQFFAYHLRFCTTF